MYELKFIKPMLTLTYDGKNFVKTKVEFAASNVINVLYTNWYIVELAETPPKNPILNFAYMNYYSRLIEMRGPK